MKRHLLIFGMCSLLTLGVQGVFADRQGFVNTVVIDPGHGGRDPGAVGSRSREKDITLAIALKLGAYISEHMPDVKIIYTREKDEFVELFRRAQIANENHADLFISIHCNSARSQAAYGTETFVMGLHRSEENLEVARKENASILFEEGYQEIYEGYDPHSPVASIIFSLYQDAYLKQSLNMAALVQDQFRERAQRSDRGVKQAGFLVLYQVTMPGILVEAGFLSNAREEQYLMSEEGQSHIASAIFRAFRDYKNHHDALAASRKIPGHVSPASETTAKESPVITPTHEDLLQSQIPSIIAPETTEENPPKPQPRLSFKVQFLLSRHPKPADAPEFAQLTDVSYYVHDNYYKYTAGSFQSFEDAAEMQKRMIAAGYRDAFVVAFLHDERIPTAEAVRLLEQYKNQLQP